jgi:hypothetical protein
VPQTVRSDPGDPGPVTRITQDRTDRLGRQRTIRRERAQEHLAKPIMRVTSKEMVDQRLTDISRDRQPVGLAALAMNRQLAGPPIDVIQGNGCDLARPQSESRQQHQDREIATTHTGRAITAGEQPRDLLALKPPR